MAARRPYCRGAFALTICEIEKVNFSDTFVGLHIMLLKQRRDPRCLLQPWLCRGAGVGEGTEPAPEVLILE